MPLTVEAAPLPHVMVPNHLQRVAFRLFCIGFCIDCIGLQSSKVNNNTADSAFLHKHDHLSYKTGRKWVKFSYGSNY